MQLWFARSNEVSIREQLVTQVILGILSDDLAPGQRLPSTRELARRFHLHPNTISAGYRQLAEKRWVEFRRGSGVYVRARKPEAPLSADLVLDQLIAQVFRAARKFGLSYPELRSRLQNQLKLRPPDHFLVVEPDEELRCILAAEIQKAVKLPVESCRLEDCVAMIDCSIPVMLVNREASVRKLLPAGIELIALQVRSVPTSLSGYLPAPAGALVGIASRWEEFLKLARAVLNAAGFAPESLIFRDARQLNWQRGLKQTAAVVCDSLIAEELPDGCRAIPFPLVSLASIEELRRYEAFVRQPIESM